MKLSVKILGIPFLFAGLLASASALAQTATPTPAASTTLRMTDSAPAGVSSYDPGTPSAGTSSGTVPTIYGGMVVNSTVMTGTCATPNENETCNSCDGTGGLKPCNPTSIHPNLLMRVTLVSNTKDIFTGAAVRFKLGTDSLLIPDIVPTTFTVGAPFTVGIRWSRLCASTSGGDATCLAGINGETLTIGIVKSGESTFKEQVSFVVNARTLDISTATYDAYTQCDVGVAPALATAGICDFGVLPGDEKIYIAYFSPSDNALSTSHTGVKYKNMVLFYEPSFTQLSNKSNNFPLALKNNSPDIPSLSSRKITGLVNDQTYCFALGNQDQAGNISYFTPASELNGSNPAKVKKYCAIPSEVVGLLDDKSCFIATATFGSQMAPEVVTFRKFRNEFLLTNTPGRAFVKAYYKYGPIGAQWISESPFLKSSALVVLWPLLLFVKLSLAVGVWIALLISLVSVFVFYTLIQHLRLYRTKAGEA